MFGNSLEKRFMHNIWNDLERLQNELSGGLGNAFFSRQGYFPPVNLYTNKDEIVMVVQVPGFEPDDIEITVVDTKVNLKGTRKGGDLEGMDIHRQETHSKDFIRSIELPYQVNSEKVEAAYKNGILKVVLPKAEAEKPRKIAVKAGN
ncbi:MAG: Hsp20/alpha crystallin family protein [Leptospiraceae bacterium]|nr:Hsp20/alpha crystallin family protein [Leptospiraceae bacterium]MCP5500250.1 Hsp20/alpha crystallin family protein [Leptospiraceae bacterium]